MCVASVPLLVKRTRSAQGTMACTSPAHSTSSAWQLPNWVPSISCAWAAAITVGGQCPIMWLPWPP